MNDIIKNQERKKDLAGVKSCIINFLSGKADNFNNQCVDEVLQMEHKDFNIDNSKYTDPEKFHCEFDPKEHFGRIDCIDVDKFAIKKYEDGLYLVVEQEDKK